MQHMFSVTGADFEPEDIVADIKVKTSAAEATVKIV
jgi:hypothetical protein